ncbi:MAG: AMIN domain-containing protein, partial [Candidatus Acidiferrum sp.]
MSAGYQIRRVARWLLLLLTLIALALPASARGKSLAQRKKLAAGQFETAEKLRQSLESTPRKERTRQEYARAIEAYHRVYFITPNFNKDDASLFAEAELLEESGQLFRNSEDSENAVERYRFLMAQYPGSTHNVVALYNIDEIYQDDLQDGAKAKAAFEEFLKRHPKHEYSDAARQAIAEIDSPAPHIVAKNAGAQKGAGSKRAESPSVNSKAVAAQARPAPAASAAKETPAGPQAKTATTSAAEEAPAEPPEDGKRVLVAGVREWATPDYTRVEIALEGKVAYQAGRIDSPDRIFFDLSESKLAPSLFGKSIVVDDGILKKIRMAQYQPGMTRVVLEVAPESEYTASLAANPSRLIIDLRGKQMAHTQAAKPEKHESGPVKLAATQPAPAQHNAAGNSRAAAELASVAP